MQSARRALYARAIEVVPHLEQDFAAPRELGQAGAFLPVSRQTGERHRDEPSTIEHGIRQLDHLGELETCKFSIYAHVHRQLSGPFVRLHSTTPLHGVTCHSEFAESSRREVGGGTSC